MGRNLGNHDQGQWLVDIFQLLRRSLPAMIRESGACIHAALLEIQADNDFTDIQVLLHPGMGVVYCRYLVHGINRWL